MQTLEQTDIITEKVQIKGDRRFFARMLQPGYASMIKLSTRFNVTKQKVACRRWFAPPSLLWRLPRCDRAELLEALTKVKRKRAAAFARTVAAEAARDDKVEEVKTRDIDDTDTDKQARPYTPFLGTAITAVVLDIDSTR